MQRLGQIWQSLMEGGNRFLSLDSQKRSNRILNRFYILFGFFLVFVSAFHVLLLEDIFHGAYSRCTEASWLCLQFPKIGFVTVAVIILLFFLKNFYGAFRLANFSFFVFAFSYLSVFAIVYPRGTNAAYLSLLLLLLPFVLWNLQEKWLSFLELSLVVLQLAALPLVFPVEVSPFEISRGYQNGIAFAVRAFLFYGFSSFIFSLLERLNRTEKQFVAEQKLRDRLLTDIIPALEQSEKRYSHLVEQAPDIVFSINEDFRLKTINKTVRKILQYEVAQLIGQPLATIVYSDGDADLDRQILADNLQVVLTSKVSAHFRLNLKGKHQPEAIPMQISLSYSESEGHREILGKAASLIEDKMSKFLVRERAEYILDNSLLNAESLSVQLTRNLHTRMEKSELTSLRVALREMLINAVEHGNLNITFDEKTQAQAEGRYLDFLKERQAGTVYAQRRVRVEYVLKNYMVAFRITDEGVGFDFEKFVQADQDSFNDEGLQHGRGILMTRHVFDRIQYFAPGNRVILAKRF